MSKKKKLAAIQMSKKKLTAIEKEIKRRRLHPFIEVAEFDKILTKLPERLWPIVMFLYETGRRVGEATKLTWKSILLIDRDEVAFILPENGDRYPFTNELAALLRKQSPPANGLAFDSHGLKAAWMKAAGDGLLLHDLRRSAIRNMVRAGIDKKTVCKISGLKAI